MGTETIQLKLSDEYFCLMNSLLHSVVKQIFDGKCRVKALALFKWK